MIEINAILSKICLVVMDFDGVHTDGFVYLDQDGHEIVRCSRRDSLGLNMLMRHGIKLCVISKEKNPVVRARCEKLGIDYFQGVTDADGKAEILAALCVKEDISPAQTLFIGDDINDIEAMRFAGVSVTVADGHDLVQKEADLMLTRKGGEHALRELCDLILSAKGLPIAY